MTDKYMRCGKCKGDTFRLLATKLSEEDHEIEDFEIECINCGVLRH